MLLSLQGMGSYLHRSENPKKTFRPEGSYITLAKSNKLWRCDKIKARWLAFGAEHSDVWQGDQYLHEGN